MAGKRNTIQRRLIGNAVRELNIHATAEEIYEHVAKSYPALSKATVYRNLNQMAEAGELRAVGNVMGAVRYDHNLHRHAHFLCDRCGAVFDVTGFPPELDGPLEGMEGFTVRSRSLTFSGFCPECGPERAAAPVVA